MLCTSLFVVSGLVAAVSAHFQLQYPQPRGVFVEDDEPTFCDGYTNAANRSQFPLSNSFIDLNSEHPTWTAGVSVSVESNPSNFGAFNTTSSGTKLPFAVPFFQASGEGKLCFPINLGSLGVQGIQDGANVSILITFDGGDGPLYQCSDLTLSSSFTAPQNQCVNSTGVKITKSGSSSPVASASSGGAASGGSSAPAPTSSTSSTGSASHAGVAGAVNLLSFVAVVASFL